MIRIAVPIAVCLLSACSSPSNTPSSSGPEAPAQRSAGGADGCMHGVWSVGSFQFETGPDRVVSATSSVEVARHAVSGCAVSAVLYERPDGAGTSYVVRHRVSWQAARPVVGAQVLTCNAGAGWQPDPDGACPVAEERTSLMARLMPR